MSNTLSYPATAEQLKNNLRGAKRHVSPHDIAQRNPEAAQQKAREHIENAEQTLLLEMEQLRQSN